MENQSGSKLLTTEEAASFLGMAPDTLVVWRCTRRVNLPYVKLGRAIRYRLEDLTAFVSASRVVGSEVA